jgi:hypothetical protein
MEKQTAVEWFVEQLNINGTVIPMAIEYKAKEMEKEQMIELWNMAVTCESFEQYYNETFKSE